MADNSKNITKVWRPVKQFLLFAVTGVLIFSLYSAADAGIDGQVSRVMVYIQPLDGDIVLVTKPIIASILKNDYRSTIKGASITSLDMTAIERIIEKNNYVKDAQVYVDARNTMHIKVFQRNPILRVISANESSFYIDEEGKKIPFRSDAVMRLPVLTGDLPYYKSAMATDKKSVYSDVLTLMKAVDQDPFMKALTEQIVVDPEVGLCIYPKLGHHRIIFGNAERAEQKFRKLEIFYKQAMPKDGWNVYKEINLKYKDQVIARKEPLVVLQS